MGFFLFIAALGSIFVGFYIVIFSIRIVVLFIEWLKSVFK